MLSDLFGHLSNSSRTAFWPMVLVIVSIALLGSGCSGPVGTAFKKAAGSCVAVQNLTASQYTVVVELGDGKRAKIGYGESKTLSVALVGDEDEIDITVAVLNDGETVMTDSETIRFDDDKAGCEQVTISLEDRDGIDIEI